MREIKFRAWHNAKRKMQSWDWILGHTQVPYILRGMLQTLELMQYTGLKDKNGVEIYEGDVLAAEGMYNDVVVFQNACFEAKGGDLYESIAALPEHYGPMEVIGNIYENPELMDTSA